MVDCHETPLIPESDAEFVAAVYGADSTHKVQSHPPFRLRTLLLMLGLLKRRFMDTPLKKRLFNIFLAIALIVTFMFTFFGMNWWVHSFEGKSSAYVFILVPSTAWTLMLWLCVPIFRCLKPRERLLFFWPTSESAQSQDASPAAVEDGKLELDALRASRSKWVGVKWMGAIGLMDALAGLTVVYAIPHVPPFLQSIIFSMSPLVTWVTMKVIDSHRAPPLNAWLVVTFVLVILGVLAASAHSLDTFTDGGGAGAGWVTIFILSQCLPVFYNVVQGKFLTHYENDAEWGTAKLSVLIGDVTLTAVYSALMLPVDSIPWFGTSDSPADTLKGTQRGLECMGNCPNNLFYFFMYCFGFVSNRAVFTFLNHYSPTLGSFIAQVCGPLNALLIIVVPAVDTQPGDSTWYYQVTSLVLLIAASVVYSAYEEVIRMHDRILQAKPDAFDESAQGEALTEIAKKPFEKM